MLSRFQAYFLLTVYLTPADLRRVLSTNAVDLSLVDDCLTFFVGYTRTLSVYDVITVVFF